MARSISKELHGVNVAASAIAHVGAMENEVECMKDVVFINT
jgi:hypothetical protein